MHAEHVTLETPLGVEECRRRLARTTSPAIALLAPSPTPVRGVVGRRRFLLGRADATRVPLRTWASGRLDERAPGGPTAVDLRLGPHPLLGACALAIATVVSTAACLATSLAVAGVEGATACAALSWMVVLGAAGLFFGVPAAGHAEERAFLLAHLGRTLEASPGRERA